MQKKETNMNDRNYTTTFTVDQTPEEVFAAINNPRGWWSEEIEGSTDKLDDEWDYHYEDVHRSTMKITEFISNKKVVWDVQDNYFNFTQDKTEWIGNKIIFEISRSGDKTEVRFTQLGLVPEYECFDICSNAWGSYINGSLRSLITKGKGKPNPKESGNKESEISDKSYSTTFMVNQTPEEAFAAINNVRGWWAGDFEGDADKLGAEFTYRYEPHHYSKQKVTEFIPGKKVVWDVLESSLNFVDDKSEWKGTKITFDIAKKGEKTEVRFTHVGLVPNIECFGA
jgi:hypothetical protein